MSTQVDIIAAIKTLAEGLNYTVFETDISEKDLADTQLPALVISNIATDFSTQNGNFGWVESYTIGLIIKLAYSSSNLSALVSAQSALIRAMLGSKTLQDLCVKHSIMPKTSNASNAIAQHSPNGSKAITCVLNIGCQAVQSI